MLQRAVASLSHASGRVVCCACGSLAAVVEQRTLHLSPTSRLPSTGTASIMADRAYMEEHDVQNQIQLALAQIVREKPEVPLRRLAQLLAPDTYVGPFCAGEHGGQHELVYPPSAPAETATGADNDAAQPPANDDQAAANESPVPESANDPPAEA